ncbi:MAG: hypothetical protein LBV12_07855 [Puniceicoccales bacterium]|jgi:hypothetical protein|nr:hypothetical protein [Puniceicoccales bacterium]
MFSKKPWLWFILAWILFIGMTVATLVIAQKNKPATVPLDSDKPAHPLYST